MNRVCIDVGGTFTDCLVMTEAGELHAFKSPSTPAALATGFLNSLEKAARFFNQSLQSFLREVDISVHGTTLATNTLITGRGAKTAMITTKGFRDLVEVRRGIKDERVSLYNFFIPPYEPLAPRYLRYAVEERTLYTGEMMTPLNEEELDEIVSQLKKESVESVAICFLHSYANPQNEKKAAEICSRELDGAYVSVSHAILPVWGEFERFSATLIDAYVGRIVSDYFHSLEKQLREAGLGGRLLIMLTNGLMQTVDYSARSAVYLIGSGPAAAPSGAQYLGDLTGHKDLITVDMGGTSFDVCVIRDREIPTTTERWEGDHRLAIKMVDVHSVGAGGGSIAWVDSLGLLRVGPQSAGAEPGPACYGKGGTEPTVTDADLLMGYLPADYFLGGEITLNQELARAAVEKVGQPLSMGAKEAAEAIFTTINTVMANSITDVSTKRGFDVRDFVMVAGGGAGPVHAAFIAEHLDIPTVLIPSYSALFSAFGMHAMDIGRDYARTYVARADRLEIDRVTGIYEEMEREARKDVEAMGFPANDIVLSRTAEMRYIRQFHQVESEIPPGELSQSDVTTILDGFHKRHEDLYTFSMPWRAVEFITFRLKATVRRGAITLMKIQSGSEDASSALKRKRVCRLSGRDVEVPVYDGTRLLGGNVIRGPAIVEEPATTVVIPERYSARVDDYKNYLLHRQ
jgi:N-methylhydantoinase A